MEKIWKIFIHYNCWLTRGVRKRRRGYNLGNDNVRDNKVTGLKL